MHKTIHLLLLLIYSGTSFAVMSIVEYTKNMDKHAGFYDFFWDQETGRILLQIDQFDQDFLYVNGLQSGVGSNDIGLDRGQISVQKLVRFSRLGNKVLLIQPNLYYQATGSNPMEKVAVEDSFAQSALWGGEVVAAFKDSVLIDMTSFLLSDSHGIAERLKVLKQGSYVFDQNRSAIYMKNTKNFTDNTEFEALITLKGNQPGKFVSSVTPTAESLTVRVHNSFIRLPTIPYKTRKFDSRSGAIFTSYNDYTVALGENIEQKIVTRHRLEKKYPELSVSDPIEPIIYYLDAGTPEPIRSALLTGAGWWSEGFESIGFSNAFQIKLLPENIDPLDVRYNVIQWVHRSTRGWSYGSSIIDPRTGEILKGHVTLGSLRVRQDMLIAQGMLSPYKNNNKHVNAIEEMALSRLRQLAAHEVGHTLGLMHNFNASSQGRSSVMDYPHPLITLDDKGEIDITDAYTKEIGQWDKISLAYLYSEFSNNEIEELENILKESARKGYVYISDQDARNRGSSHPTAHLWDNGTDVISGLENIIKVRQKALREFGLNTIRAGQEVFKLEQILTPIYLFHRYQMAAVGKLIGGVDYKYAHKGEMNVKLRVVSAKEQARALNALMLTLNADFLAVPENILSIMLPPPEGSYRHREHFEHRTGPHFDAMAAAQTAAQLTLSYLLNPQRASRLIEQKALANSTAFQGLDEVVSQLIENSWKKHWDDSYYAEVQRSINWVVLNRLMELAINKKSSPQVRAICIDQLKQLKKLLTKVNKKDKLNQVAAQQAIRLINNFLINGKIAEDLLLKVPPGSPI